MTAASSLPCPSWCEKPPGHGFIAADCSGNLQRFHAAWFGGRLVELSGRWQPETRKSARSACRSFYQWAVATGRTDSDPTRTLRPVRVPAGVPKPCPEAAIRAALENASDRDRLMRRR